MSAIFTIEQKQSGTGTIHDLASQHFDRDIEFGNGRKYAVVKAAYYGGKGYTTHKTKEAAIEASERISDYSHSIIDVEGNVYDAHGDELVWGGKL